MWNANVRHQTQNMNGTLGLHCTHPSNKIYFISFVVWIRGLYELQNGNSWRQRHSLSAWCFFALKFGWIINFCCADCSSFFSDDSDASLAINKWIMISRGATNRQMTAVGRISDSQSANPNPFAENWIAWHTYGAHNHRQCYFEYFHIY